MTEAKEKYKAAQDGSRDGCSGICLEGTKVLTPEELLPTD